MASVLTSYNPAIMVDVLLDAGIRRFATRDLYSNSAINLFSYPSEFDNAWWTSVNLTTISANGMKAPDGTTTADGWVADAVDTFHMIRNTTKITGVTQNDKVAVTVYAKPGDEDWAMIQVLFYNAAGGFLDDVGYVYWDIANGTIGTTVDANNATIHDVIIEEAPNGFYKIGFIVSNNDAATAEISVQLRSATADNDSLFAGDATTVNTWWWHAWIAVTDQIDYFYKGTLLSDLSVTQQLSDLYYGVEQAASITLQFANAESNVDDTWDDIVVTNSDELRGRWVLIQRYDPVEGVSFEVRGRITGYSLGDTVDITVEIRDDDILETLLPWETVTPDKFHGTALDVGAPINICIGHCRDVPLWNIKNDTDADEYDYLVGYAILESLWVNHTIGLGVKREGVLVDASEYTFVDGSAGDYPGYAYIRFTTEQMNFSGQFHSISADVKGLEMGGSVAQRNFVTVIENLLLGPGLVNGNMEIDDNWETYTSPTVNERSTTQVYGGNYSRKFTSDGAQDGIQSDPFTTRTGIFYHVKLYVYPDDGTQIQVMVRRGDDSDWVYDTLHDGLVQGAWNEITFSYRETHGGALGVIVIHDDAADTGDFYVDEVSISTWGLDDNRNATSFAAAAAVLDAIGVNHVLYSCELDDAAWGRNQLTTVSADGTTAPDGTLTADGLVANVNDVSHNAYSATLITGVSANQNCALTVYAKAGDINWCRIRVHFYTAGDADLGDWAQCYFDLANGVIGTSQDQSQGVFVEAMIEEAANGFYKIGIIGHTTDGTVGKVRVYVFGAEGDVDPGYIGDTSTVNTWFWGADLKFEDFFSAPVYTVAAAAGSMYCDLAIVEQRKARDIIDDLLFPARARIWRASNGEWDIAVDQEGSSVLTLADNDPEYGSNCEVVSAPSVPTTEAIRRVVIQYSAHPTKEISFEAHTGFGVARTYELACVAEDCTAGRVLYYIVNRSVYADGRVNIRIGMEGRDLSVGDIVTVTAPRRNISDKEYTIEDFSKGLTGFELTCREYSALIFGGFGVQFSVMVEPREFTVKGPATWVGPINVGDASNASAQIIMNAPSGVGDVYIAAGTLNMAAWTAAPGFILGLDDSDGDKPKVFIGNSGGNYMSWDGSALTVVGTITATAGTIGGWTIIAGYIYSLAGGAPAAAPEDGVVLASGNPAFIAYENTEKRFEAGYLAAGIYGVRGYADDGATIIFELSDTQTSTGGWDMTETTLSCANITLDAGNDKITVNTLTIDGANNRIRSANYVAGMAGAGFTLDPDLLEVGNIAARGIIRTAVFQKDIISAVGGNLAVMSADVLDTDIDDVTADLVTNGGFGADTDWAKGDGWTIAAGVANCDGTQAAATNLDQDIGLTIGNTYRISFTISNYAAGNVTPYAGGMGAGTARSANGTYTENITCANTTLIYLRGDADFEGDIDDVECHLISADLVIEGNETFVNGDLLRIKDDTDDEWFEVTDAAGAPTYVVERDQASTYLSVSCPVWNKGASVVNYKQSGDGMVLMTSSEANAPYMSVVTHAGAPWTTLTTRLRIGNLNGFLGYADDLYGIAIGEVDKYMTYDPTNGMTIKGLLTSCEIASGTITGALITAGTFQTASGDVKKVIINSDGVSLHMTASVGQYSEFEYGDGTKYGSGALAYIHHSASSVPFYISAEQAVADFHFYDRAANPTGAAEIGDVCVVNGALKICTVAGTPGTWALV